MLAISIGPLAFPAQPLVLLAAIWVATIAANRLARPKPAPSPASGASAGDAGLALRAENTVWIAALVGLAVARAGHLVQHLSAYAASPWSMLDLRDGGWAAAPGWAAAAGWIAWRVMRQRALRRSVAGAVLAGLLVWGAGQGALHLAGGSGAGEPAPDVELMSLDDRRAERLPQVIAGRPTVVNLWASWCGPCREEMPLLAEIQRTRADVRVVFVNQGETERVVREYLARERLAIDEVWLDRGLTLGPAVGSVGLPTTLFFDAEGRRADAHFGVINAAALQARIDRLVAAP